METNEIDLVGDVEILNKLADLNNMLIYLDSLPDEVFGEELTSLNAEVGMMKWVLSDLLADGVSMVQMRKIEAKMSEFRSKLMTATSNEDDC